MVWLAVLAQATVVVSAALAPDRVVVEGGRELALYGVEAAPLSPFPQAEVDELVRGEWIHTPYPWWDEVRGDYTEAAWLRRGSQALSCELVRRGLALGTVTARHPHHASELLLAAREAQSAGSGIWSERRRPPADPTPGPVAGVALTLHSKDPAYSYERELREIRELGASWVNLIVVTRQERVDSSHVPLASLRTPPFERIVATIARARELGLEVLLMPIVLIANPGPDDWRGSLAPAELDPWWQSYGRFIVRMADAGATGGATALCIGSELSSLETYTDAWRRVITNVRLRFPGYLTYSANWDHFDELEFWGELDFAGLTGYFELADDSRAPQQDLIAGWRDACAEVTRLTRHCDLPVVFTEVGLPSVRGAAATPWDYTLEAEIDLDVQKRAFEAFESVFIPDARPAPPLHGLFLYEWWGWGGEADGSYTARGKPAAVLWRRILAAFRTAKY